MNANFSEIIKKAQVIPENRNYWLVRSMGGDYYWNFIEGQYIGIGYEKILLSEIKYSHSLGPKAQETLRQIIQGKYNEETDNVNPSYAAAQLLKFATEIQNDDIIIVPAKSDDKLVSIGIVISKIYEEEEPDDDCPFKKRIKIKWITRSDRASLNPYLQLIFNSRHIVSNINHYSEYIDCASIDLFRKDENTYLVLKVNKQDDISTSDFFVVNDLLDLVNDFSQESGLQINRDDIKIKVCMQSPGDITLFSHLPEVIFLLGLIIIALNGGGLKIDRLGFDLSTMGLIKNISDFLDRRADRKRQEILTKKLQALQIEDPQALLDIIKEMKNEREKY